MLLHIVALVSVCLCVGEKPGEKYDLSKFKLQTCLKSAPKEIKGSDLKHYSDSRFYLSEDGGVVMKVYSNDEAKFSHYPRTEFEDTSVPSWKWGHGSHSIKATVKVVTVPDGKSTVIGQVHGDHDKGGELDMLLKLRYMHDGTLEARVKDHDGHEFTHGNLGRVSLGNEFKYEIRCEGKTLKVIVNDKSTDYEPPTKSVQTFYLKAGNYLQTNSGNEVGEVRFYALSTSHAQERHRRSMPQASRKSFCSASGWKQVWADEFSGSKLDTDAWTIDTHSGNGRTRDALGTVDNVYVENGALVLRSQRQKKKGHDFTTGAVASKGKRSWKGKTRACVSAALPGVGLGKGDGVWPAIWMDPDHVHKNSEIDILEMINGDGKARTTYHWGSHQDQQSNPLPDDWATAMHEYAVEYSSEGVTYALDGEPVHTVSKKADFFDEAYYMILNTAIGGSWPKPVSSKTQFPTYYRIDYVRISQPEKIEFV